MRKNILLLFSFILFVTFAFSGCAIAPKSYKEKTLDDLYPILTEEEYQTFKSLESKNKMNIFLEEFWRNVDSTSDNSEFKNEYLQRLEYANKHFPDQRGWGRSDRKRIYLIHGPPSYVDKRELTNIQIETFSTIKAIEIWYYMKPGSNNSLPSSGDDLHKGEQKFIFADMTGNGIYQILYSSEESADIDVRLLYKLQ
jgi:GWxTD domain-containing protein